MIENLKENSEGKLKAGLSKKMCFLGEEAGRKQNTEEKTTIEVRSEQGITMVALVVMIIILIILALITIGTITGRLGILDISTEVAGTYGTEQNRSRLEALVEDTILKYDIVGEKLTTEKLAEEIEKEDWIKKAEVRKDEDGKPNDILVETEDGDNFQVEYDEETGEKHIHELGKSDGESFPKVEAEYERESTSIKAKAYDEDTGIEKIEIIYGGEVVGTQEGDTAEFKVSKSGTYTVKATANSGKVAYTTARVSMKLRAPTIRITSQGKIQNGWYGGDGIPVEVTISTEDKLVTEVHYMLRGVTQQEDTSVAGQETTVTITNPGRTIITGYTKDGAGNESEYVTQDVKYDNVKPRIDKIEAEGEKGNNDWFISDVILSAEKAEDANSGVAGYYYYVLTEEDISSNKVPSIEEMTYVSGQDRKMTVRRNGRTTILLVIEDKAGNKSDIKTVAVKKDNEPPRDFQASYTNVGSRGFDITAATTDEHSGVVNYNFFVNINGEDIAKGSSEDGNGTIGDLEPKETYIVYVEAEDEAGNKKISTNMQVTTKGEVLPPTIELACPYKETNGWYRGDVDVTIRDSSTDDKSDLASITYRVEGANELDQRTEPGRRTNFQVTEEGISNVIAFGTGTGGNISKESTKEIKIDVTEPSKAELKVNSYDTTVINVTAEGEDDTSGIAGYQFQYKKASEEIWQDSGNMQASTENTFTYDYTGLQAGHTYDLRVIITDKAGNTKEARTKVSVVSITLTPTEVEIEETKTATLSATIEPEDATNQELIWKAEPTDVVSISEDETNGKTVTITGLKAGDAIVTVQLKDNPNITATSTIKVKPIIYVMLYEDGTLTFGPDSHFLEGKTLYKNYGNIIELGFEAIPDGDDNVIWAGERDRITQVDFVGEIHPTSTAAWFRACKNLTKIDHIENLDTSIVTDMSFMFSQCSNLTNLDVSHFKTKNVKSMQSMFNECSNLTSLDVRNFDTSNVENMRSTFRNCTNLKQLDVSNFNTDKVTTMYALFMGCSNLTNLDVHSFNTEHVTDMRNMFSGCGGLTQLNLSNFTTGSVTDMGYMFYSCTSLNQLNLSGLDTSQVATMTYMFCDCSSLTNIDVRSFNTANVTDMKGMFENCKSLTKIDVSSFNTANVTDMKGMFENCKSLTKMIMYNMVCEI